MLSKEDNEFACRVGPGTPMGELFRRFWLPAMLPDELPHADCPPVRLRLLGEDLVAFRDSNNKIGVVEAHCPHRGASLYFGRNVLPLVAAQARAPALEDDPSMRIPDAPLALE